MQNTENSTLSPTISTIDPIDALLAREDLYALNPAAVTELRIQYLREAVAYHRQHNPSFERYCTRLAFDEHNLRSEADLARIPLLPTGLFKRHPELLRSQSADAAIIATTSSGTKGTVSVVPRDDVTLMRFFASIAIGNREVLEVESFDRTIFNIGPSVRDAPNVWIAYVMAGASVIYTTNFYVQNDYFAIDRLLTDLRRVPPGSGVSVVGPPALLIDVVKILESSGTLALGPEALIITIGGWKRRQGEMITRDEFDARVAAAFGIPDCSRVRDTYNMVELNTVIFECAHKVKHVPPWLYAAARDPRTLEVQPSGSSGLLSFLDPTPLSYPCFILSDDFGKVQRQVACPCGITGDTIQIERRVNRVEMRGCALKLETVVRPEASA